MVSAHPNSEGRTPGHKATDPIVDAHAVSAELMSSPTQSNATARTSDRQAASTILTRRPLLTVAVGASIIAIGHAVWIFQHRHVGALDPDEAGYIATAMRFQRSIDVSHPLEFFRQVGGTANGVTVPLLSIVPLILGARSPQTAMLAQPILLVVTAVAIAGATKAVARPSTAIGAGLAYCAFPTVIWATQSYWYGLGAAAFTALALWALMTSDGCMNRRIWWFGLAVGATLLTRTMMLGFLPAFGLAALVCAGWNRRAITRATAAMCLAIAFAAPIYLVNRDAIFDYLFSYGYGERAGLFGSGGPWERFTFRLGRVADGMGIEPVQTACALVVLGGVIALVRNRHRAFNGRRDLAAIATFGAVALAALVSTTNNGVWFELPVIVAATAVIAVGIDRLHWSARTAAAATFAGMAVMQLPVSWWWLPTTTKGVAPIAVNYLKATHYEGGFVQYDPRFATTSRNLHPVAAKDWARASDDVRALLTRLRDPDDPPLSLWLSGNFQLFNTNTLALSGEIAGEPTSLFVPDTVVSEKDRERLLTPTFGVRERVLVFALHNQHLFTPDAEVKSFYRQARAAGWKPIDTVLLPLHGRVEILVHPGSQLSTS